MTTVWKYTIPLTGRFELQMPKGARILSVQTQHMVNRPYIWARVETAGENEMRAFVVRETGQAFQGKANEGAGGRTSARFRWTTETWSFTYLRRLNAIY